MGWPNNWKKYYPLSIKLPKNITVGWYHLYTEALKKQLTSNMSRPSSWRLVSAETDPDDEDPKEDPEEDAPKEDPELLMDETEVELDC